MQKTASPKAKARDGSEKKRFEITVHRKNPEDPPFVDVQVNGGGATRIRVGQKVQVTPETLEALQNAEETTYRFYGQDGIDVGADEQTAPLYPVTVHGEVAVQA